MNLDSPSNAWIAFDEIPNPTPPDWNNNNIYIDGTLLVNGAEALAVVTLMDISHTPPIDVTWSTFLQNPNNPHWVPLIYTNLPIVCAPNLPCSLSITFNDVHNHQIICYWAGYATAKWFGMGNTGYYQATGFNYDIETYPTRN